MEQAMTDLSRLSDEERQWAENKAERCPECELSLIHGQCVMCGWFDPLPETLERLSAERRKWPAEMAKVTALGDECTPQEVADFIADLTNVAMERLSYGAEQKQRAEAAEQRIAELEADNASMEIKQCEIEGRALEAERQLAECREALKKSAGELDHVAAHELPADARELRIHAEALQICMEREADRLRDVLSTPQGAAPPVSPELTEALNKANNHVMTPEERHEQRISFAAGSLAMSTGEPIEVVKERMREADAEMRGAAPQKEVGE